MSSSEAGSSSSNAARPSSATASKRSKSTASYLGRSVTAFELHSHYSHRNIYPTFSSGYAMRQKYFALRDHHHQHHDLERGRPKSSVNNLMKRSYTTALIRATSRKRLYDKDVSPKEEIYEEELLMPKRSIFTLIRIAMVYFGIEVLFSLETALAIPILLKLKVPENLYSFVYFLSPLFGFLFQPILGVMSDRCESRFGRRRPFILVLSIGAFIGASLILNGYLIGDWLGDSKLKIPYFAIVLVGTGVTFLDFCADSTDSPLRAFLLDVCNPEDQDTGLNIHAILGGTGAALGFILGAIDWNQTFLHSIGDELQILYVFSSVIFIIGLVITLTSAKEIPIVLLKNNKERMPLIESANNLLVLPEEVFDEQDNKKDDESQEEEEDDEDFDQPITLRTLLHSILKMPKELIRLIICQTFGWIAYFSLTLFMTDFCGQSIYHGDPSAPQDSELFKKYNDGVKMGCWCLLVYSVTSAISALVLENFLMKRFATRTLYFFYFFIYAICSGCMYFQTSIYVIMPLCASIGVLLTSLTTLPYQMLSDFHKDKNYRNQSAAGTKRGLGVDCSLLSSCYFLSQTFTSAFMSFLTTAFGNYVIVISASLFSFAGCLWISLFVIFPRDCNNNNNSNSSSNQTKSNTDDSMTKA